MNVTDTPLLACAHEPPPGNTGTGWGTWIPSGEKLCYECLDQRETDRIRNGAEYVGAYISTDGLVTTWSGGKLGRVVRVKNSRRGSYTLTYIRAVLAGGRLFYGQYNADRGNLITLHATKN